jgi:hypothetical protein
MPNDTPKPAKFPLLETVLAHKNLVLKAFYTMHDAADIFGVTVRAIQHWVKRGRLVSRELPGRAKFLSIDLETFLGNSQQKHAGVS